MNAREAALPSEAALPKGGERTPQLAVATKTQLWMPATARLIVLLLLLAILQLSMPSKVTKLQPQFRTMQRAAKQDFVTQQMEAHRAAGCLVFSKTY